MSQGELFNRDVVQKVVNGLRCNNCGELQPVDQFQHMNSGEIKRKCRTCSRNQSRLVQELKSKHPYPDKDYCCPICTRNIDAIGSNGQKRLQNWVLDHCHESETFRGWLCHHCNTGLGAFKDSIDRVRNAVIYLDKHEETLNDEQTTND